MAWIDEFDERQQSEIAFARLYAADFHHGTSGHMGYMVMAKMADLLDGMPPASAAIDPAVEAYLRSMMAKLEPSRVPYQVDPPPLPRFLGASERVMPVKPFEATVDAMVMAEAAGKKVNLVDSGPERPGKPFEEPGIWDEATARWRPMTVHDHAPLAKPAPNEPLGARMADGTRRIGGPLEGGMSIRFGSAKTGDG